MSDSRLPLHKPGTSAVEETDSKKKIQPLRVFLGVAAALVLLTAGPFGWILLVVFLVISFNKDRGMFVGGLIGLCLVLLLIASCLVLLSRLRFD